MPHESQGVHTPGIRLDPTPDHAGQPPDRLDAGRYVQYASRPSAVRGAARNGRNPEGSPRDGRDDRLQLLAGEQAAMVCGGVQSGDLAQSRRIGEIPSLRRGFGVFQRATESHVVRPQFRRPVETPLVDKAVAIHLRLLVRHVAPILALFVSATARTGARSSRIAIENRKHAPLET